MTVLASASPARADLLRSAGLEFEIQPAQVDEEALKSVLLKRGLAPDAIAEELATAKALSVSRERPDVVIGADQTLEFEGETFGKAGDSAEARKCLLRLRGRTHRLHTGAAIVRNGRVTWRHVASVSMTMRNFSESFLDSYLDRCGEAILGSVGYYHFEGLGVQLFDRVIGDYYAILGLPLIRLLTALRREGVLAE